MTATIHHVDLRWREQAACHNHPNPGLWTADNNPPAAIREAQVICAACPVETACLAHALKHEPFDVWGGLTAPQRKRLGGVCREK